MAWISILVLVVVALLATIVLFSVATNLAWTILATVSAVAAVAVGLAFVAHRLQARSRVRWQLEAGILVDRRWVEENVAEYRNATWYKGELWLSPIPLSNCLDEHGEPMNSRRIDPRAEKEVASWLVERGIEVTATVSI